MTPVLVPFFLNLPKCSKKYKYFKILVAEKGSENYSIQNQYYDTMKKFRHIDNNIFDLMEINIQCSLKDGTH